MLYLIWRSLQYARTHKHAPKATEPHEIVSRGRNRIVNIGTDTYIHTHHTQTYRRTTQTPEPHEVVSRGRCDDG